VGHVDTATATRPGARPRRSPALVASLAVLLLVAGCAASSPTVTARRDHRKASPPSNCPPPIVIDADRLEASKSRGLVFFMGSVVARLDSATQTADRMEVYLDDEGERMLRIVAIGSVRVVTDDGRTGTSHRAEYDDEAQRLVLLGEASVRDAGSVVTGERVEMVLAGDGRCEHRKAPESPALPPEHEEASWPGYRRSS
jgi:lipopolysaccharide transport protein LptA